MTDKKITVTLTRSPIGALPKHKLCLKGLGLRRMHQSVTVEDTPASMDELKLKFGNEIATLVDGVTKISKMKTQSDIKNQAENFRKLILAVSKDIKVLLVKLADRLHNMRTITFVPRDEKRKRIAILPLRQTIETSSVDPNRATRMLNQALTNYLVQTRKFTVLDRDFDEEVFSELENLEESANVDDHAKIGQKLFADYILVGRLETFDVKEVENMLNYFADKLLSSR